MDRMCERMQTDCENRNWAKHEQRSRYMWERKAPVLCVERLQEGVWILSQSWHGLKRRTECGKTLEPLLSLSFSQTSLQPLSVSFLSISWCFSQTLVLSLFFHSSRPTLEISQQVLLTERERESTWDYKWLLKKHLKPQKSVTRTFYSFQVVKNTISRLSIWPCELLNAQASITLTVI